MTRWIRNYKEKKKKKRNIISNGSRVTRKNIQTDKHAGQTENSFTRRLKEESNERHTHGTHKQRWNYSSFNPVFINAKGLSFANTFSPFRALYRRSMLHIREVSWARCVFLPAILINNVRSEHVHAQYSLCGICKNKRLRPSDNICGRSGTVVMSTSRKFSSIPTQSSCKINATQSRGKVGCKERSSVKNFNNNNKDLNFCYSSLINLSYQRQQHIVQFHNSTVRNTPKSEDSKWHVIDFTNELLKRHHICWP